MFLLKVITSSLTGLKNKPFSPFFRNHCPCVKKFSSPFLRDFFRQACLPEFVSSGYAGTCGSNFCDGGFNGTLDLQNIFKNSVIKSKFVCFPWLHIAIFVKKV